MARDPRRQLSLSWPWSRSGTIRQCVRCLRAPQKNVAVPQDVLLSLFSGVHAMIHKKLRATVKRPVYSVCRGGDMLDTP